MMTGEVTEPFPGRGVQQFVLLWYDGPDTKPGDLRACRHRDPVG